MASWCGLQKFVTAKNYIFLIGNFNSCTKERLKTMLWRVKWYCLFGHVYNLQKNNAQLITWSFLMIQSVSFTSAAFESFAEGYLCFFSICLAKKKNAKAIKFLGILKKYVSKNKLHFCLKNKSNVSLNKKVIFVFHKIFKLDFIKQVIYCVIHRCLYSLFILSLNLLYQFLRNGT